MIFKWEMSEYILYLTVMRFLITIRKGLLRDTATTSFFRFRGEKLDLYSVYFAIVRKRNIK